MHRSQDSHADLGLIEDDNTPDMRKASAATEAQREPAHHTKKGRSVDTLPVDGDEYVELTTSERDTEMYAYRLADIHRRIANILRAYPAEGWTLDEAQAVLATIGGVVRARQGDGSLRVAVTVDYPALGGRTTVWEVGSRASDMGGQ
ncbi:hypothetical protein [Mycolicibacterium smegmatis]|uniref:hypothetical protein n=1 Tax=Mycolicibacterium smegmatis TaxID=1772 RepID=UPI001EFB9695|nr:hypothetical protein [Mycolicibacterium smegmatis]ULN34191.1 hypothetical protein KZ781_25965 [Mycolicibacterium smegmatis]